jgi:hypothetical protein
MGAATDPNGQEKLDTTIKKNSDHSFTKKNATMAIAIKVLVSALVVVSLAAAVYTSSGSRVCI